MRIAIYGAGSLGTVLGAYLAKNGVPADLVNHNSAHVKALKENGAHITGTVDFTVPVSALLPDEMTGKYDIIFLMTKQLNNREVVSFLKEYLAEDGLVATLQNGIPEDSVAEIIGPEHTVGVVVEWGATLSAPGESTLTSAPDSLSFHMGGMSGIREEQLQRVKDVLEKMCPVEIEANLPGARWSKLLINATFSGLGTVIGGTFGDVTADPRSREIAVRCMKEVIDVGHAAGVEFPKMGVEADLQLVNMLDYDPEDPMWDTFMDQLTYEEEERYVTNDGEVGYADKEVPTGLFAYCVSGRYGLMDGNCHRLTEPLYRSIQAVNRNMFRATLLDGWSEVILNAKGEVMR